MKSANGKKFKEPQKKHAQKIKVNRIHKKEWVTVEILDMTEEEGITKRVNKY